MNPPGEVCILGLGLMGGSIGLALRERQPGIRVSGWSRRASTREEALAARVADRVPESPAEAVRGADVVVACGPIRSIPEVLRHCREGLKPGALVTDVGSTKEWLMREVPRALEGTGVLFAGSHPMCGSEQQGLSAARADLYENALVAVTGEGGAAEAAEAFWRLLGARPARMDARVHDERVAAISHLPHLAAAAVVEAALRSPDPGRDAMIAGGFRDTTRVAAGPADVWIDILRTNPDAVARLLADAAASLETARHRLETGDWAALETWLDDMRKARGKVLP